MIGIVETLTISGAISILAVSSAGMGIICLIKKLNGVIDAQNARIANLEKGTSDLEKGISDVKQVCDEIINTVQEEENERLTAISLKNADHQIQ